MNGAQPSFSTEQLDKALLDTFDLMERCKLENNYLVLGDTAKCLFEGKELEGNKIEVGIEKRYLTRETLTTLRMYADKDLTDAGLNYKFEEVPINMKFVESNDFFRYHDVRFHGPEQYNIPNPFLEYYKVKEEIK